MSLKLFRSTGYHSILDPGETRGATHPGWVILGASMWAGFVCNAGLWRQLFETGRPGLAHALVIGTLVAGACATLLSLLGWHKTLKPAATLLLALAALAACMAWNQPAPPPGSVLEVPIASLMQPTWAGMMRWQALALLAGLALVPMIWVWNTQVRRLTGPRQLGVNMTGMLAGGTLAVASAFLLFRGLA
ncbi:MAG: hypothetical protein ACAH21_18870 [Ramlibacter sp.]